MYVYEVMKGDSHESYRSGPLFHSITSAVKYAEEVVNNSQKVVLDMREFELEERPIQRTKYKDWIKVEDYVWKGGYEGAGGEIRIDSVKIER